MSGWSTNQCVSNIDSTILPADLFTHCSTSEIEQKNVAPVQVSLSVYPNPFVSWVKFGINGTLNGQPKVEIYDVKGSKVADLSSQRRNSEIIWNASGAVSGVYMIKINASNAMLVNKFTLVK